MCWCQAKYLAGYWTLAEAHSRFFYAHIQAIHRSDYQIQARRASWPRRIHSKRQISHESCTSQSPSTITWYRSRGSSGYRTATHGNRAHLRASHVPYPGSMKMGQCCRACCEMPKVISVSSQRFGVYKNTAAGCMQSFYVRRLYIQ